MHTIHAYITATAEGQQCRLGDEAEQLEGQQIADLMKCTAAIGGLIMRHFGLAAVPLQFVYTPAGQKPETLADTWRRLDREAAATTGFEQDDATKATKATKPAKTYSAELDHFLDLAVRGGHPGASGGEKRCHQIAHAILENAVGLDASAFYGLYQFTALVNTDYHRAQQLIGGRS